MNLDNSIMGHANISIKFYYLFFLAYDKCIVNHKHNSYFSFSGSTERNLKQKGTKQTKSHKANKRYNANKKQTAHKNFAICTSITRAVINGFVLCSYSFCSLRKTLLSFSLMRNSQNPFLNLISKFVFDRRVRYINILTGLQGFRVKIVSFFCLSIPKRDLSRKKTTPKIEVCPDQIQNDR